MISFVKDDCSVHQITVPTPYNVGPVNFFLLEQPDGLTLIDAGLDTEETWRIFEQSLAELNYGLVDLKRILLTHHHLDHIGLINRVLTHHKVPVFAHPLAVPRLARDPEFLSHRLDFFQSLYEEMGCGKTGKNFIEQLKNGISEHPHLRIEAEIIPIREGEPIQGMGNWSVVETPGHSPDHLVYYDRKREILFTGDHLLPKISSNAIVEPDTDGTRMATISLYRNSLIKCQSLQSETVFPGHGEAFQNHRELIEERLIRIEDKSKRLKLLTKVRGKTAFELAKEMYPTEYIRQFSLVMSEIIGLLDYLELNNQIQKEKIEKVWHYGLN